MLLQEEYLKRRRIDLPEVHHTLGTGSLIMRLDPDKSDLKSRWLVVSLHWHKNPHHPGEYELRVLTPVHNSYAQGDLFQGVRGYPPQLRVQYENLEEFFLDFATAHGKLEAVEDNPGLGLVGWEIFLFTHDSYLASSASPKLRAAIESISQR